MPLRVPRNPRLLLHLSQLRLHATHFGARLPELVIRRRQLGFDALPRKPLKGRIALGGLHSVAGRGGRH